MQNSLKREFILLVIHSTIKYKIQYNNHDKTFQFTVKKQFENIAQILKPSILFVLQIYLSYSKWDHGKVFWREMITDQEQAPQVWHEAQLWLIIWHDEKA